MAADLAALENLFLGLADKTRLRLLSLMAAGPVSVGHLVTETGDSQPKISRHLAYLRNAGLVDTTRDGKWIYYGLAELSDIRTDSVFRSVVDELSGRSAAKPAARKSRPRLSSPEPEKAMSRDDVPDEYIPREDPRYDEYEEADQEWTHPAEERHEELDVFLL